jgi:hypothetical protein
VRHSRQRIYEWHVGVACANSVYATYNLMNWGCLDTTRPVELGNIALQHVGVVQVDRKGFASGRSMAASI